MAIIMLIIIISVCVKYGRFIFVGLFTIFRVWSIGAYVTLFGAAVDSVNEYIQYGLFLGGIDSAVSLLKNLLLIDLAWSVLSFIGAIPLGKPWFTPRFPVPVTIVIMLFQIGHKKWDFYCNNCQKNLSYKEVIGKCYYCKSDIPIKFMGIDGRIYHKCLNSSCEMTSVLTINDLDDSARTRFYKSNPLGLTGRRSLHCKICGNPINNDNVVTLSLYSGREEIAKTYRAAFFYNSFGPGKKSQKMAVQPTEPLIVKRIDSLYECEGYKDGFKGVADHPLRLRLKTDQKLINKTLFQFHMVIGSTNQHKLVSSEGIVLLIEGVSNSIERQTLVDQFLVDLEPLKTSRCWNKPVLVGICANGVASLESAVSRGFEDATIMEQQCISFLMEQNNADIVSRLSSNLEHLHFFLYRTGSVGENTEGDIYNVVQPGQALMYDAHRELRAIWPMETNGCSPPLYGKSNGPFA